MRIGIITFVRADNYGAELQAFALQRKLQILGHKAEIIDYLFYKHPKHIRTRSSRPFVKIGFIRKIKESVLPIHQRLRGLFYSSVHRNKLQKFENFHKRHTVFSLNVFRDIKSLQEYTHDYDVYIAGSDQIWNPYTNTSLYPYFLAFAPSNKKKISYASSFGVSSLPQDAIPIYTQLLDKFDAIAVREPEGAKIVHELTGKVASHVVDPIFLLPPEEWDNIATKPDLNEPYLLIYTLSYSPYAIQLAQHVSKQLGIKMVRICKNAYPDDKSPDIINITDAGPSEFVGLFRNASFVITNSFHGTSFSVHFNIPFYTITKSQKNNNSRQLGLLRTLHLENRVLPENSAVPNSFSIDYSDAKLRLKEWIDNSIHYLINSLHAN